MARKTIIVTASFGRDAGKRFQITEQSADAAEEWFLRATALLGRAGQDIPLDIFGHGAVGFAVLGISAALNGLSKAQWHEVKPLMDQLMSCVGVYSPDGKVVHTDPTILNQSIEEVPTRLWLRQEVVSLHLGFSLAARLSDLKSLVGALMMTSSTTGGDTSPTTSTSPSVSAPSSAGASPVS